MSRGRSMRVFEDYEEPERFAISQRASSNELYYKHFTEGQKYRELAHEEYEMANGCSEYINAQKLAKRGIIFPQNDEEHPLSNNVALDYPMEYYDNIKLYQQHTEASKRYWNLACKEFQHCLRLKPRNEDIQNLIREAQMEADAKPTVDIINTLPLDRLLSHFNMCIRYWDEGNTALAYHECNEATKLLKDHRMPSGCIKHNRLFFDVINGYRSEIPEVTRAEYRRLAHVKRLETLDKDDIILTAKYLFDGCMYKRAMDFYKEARRQVFGDLKAAKCILVPNGNRKDFQHSLASCLHLGDGEQSKAAHGNRSLASSMEAIKKDKADRIKAAKETIKHLDNDITFIKELMDQYSITTISYQKQKEKPVDNKLVNMVPCLLSRIAGDFGECCKEWRENLLILNPNPPTTKVVKPKPHN